MLYLKKCALIALLLSLAVSKTNFVFENSTEANKSLSGWSRTWAKANSLIQEDDGLKNGSSLKTRKLDNSKRGFTCKWTCRCNEPPAPIKTTVKEFSDMKDDMKFCLFSQKVGKVLKTQADSRLDVGAGSKCEDGTTFAFKSLRPQGSRRVIAKIYNPETNKFLALGDFIKSTYQIVETSIDLENAEYFMITKEYNPSLKPDEDPAFNFIVIRRGVMTIDPGIVEANHLIAKSNVQDKGDNFTIRIVQN